MSCDAPGNGVLPLNLTEATLRGEVSPVVYENAELDG